MNDDNDKAIREADERERSNNWLARMNSNRIIFILEVIAISVML